MVSRAVVRTGAMLLVAATLVGCAQPSDPAAEFITQNPVTVPVEVTDSNGMLPGMAPTTPVAPPPAADRPDGPPPPADGDSTAADLLGLIRVSASATSTADTCAANAVRLSLSGSEAAAGHRYAQLIATNASDRACQLVGWPGLGLRGEWGTALPIVAERSTMAVDRVGVPAADSDTAVLLAVGGHAVAEFEWTGALAGNSDEHVSLIAVQLAVDEPPAALTVAPDDHVDIGPETSVRVGPWGPAA